MNKANILIVDDRHENLVSLKTLLKKVAANIISASSGNKALTLVLDHDITLILLDVNMPEMDGFEVASILNDNEDTKHIPIIFLTALDRNDENMLKGYAAGAIDFIYKPIEPIILLSKVNTFLGLYHKLHQNLNKETKLRKANEDKILFLSKHDELTELPNRRFFHAKLKDEIQRTQRHNNQFALLFLDIDGFKHVNDTLGHSAGDCLLQHLSQGFKQEIRNTDIVARYGGDEFVFLLLDIEDRDSIITKLQSIIGFASKEFQWNKHKIKVGASVGVAIYPEHGDNDSDLLSSADTAMYKAKEEGKNCFRFYNDTLNKQLQRRLLLDTHLKNALQKNELEVYYQGVVDIVNNKIIGAEALLRWQKNEDLGFVSPEEFIPICESNGTIHEIGLFVLDDVIQIMQELPDLKFAINASPLQFLNSVFYDALKAHSTKKNINMKQLEVEITERLILNEQEKEKSSLNAIDKLGASLSIDDFGTGYSSLSSLKFYPVSTVKIDKSFVMRIPNQEDEALCKAIISLADALSLDVIAEGIENEEQQRFLVAAGCKMAQGYHFCKPMPKTEFIQLVEKGLSC